MTTKEKVLLLFNEGKSNKEIAEQIGIAPNTVSYHISSLGLTRYTLDKSKFDPLYKLGMNDVEIANACNCCPETVRQWRLSNNLEPQFEYKDFRKFDYNKVRPLVEKGFTDADIADRLNVSQSSIYRVRTHVRLINRPSLAEGRPIDFAYEDLQLIFGSVLGDATLFLRDTMKNPYFSCEHGIKQKEYCKFKHDKLKKYGFKYREYTRNKIDERTGIYYESAVCVGPATPSLHDLYNHFYTDGKKVIPVELLDRFYTPFAMAIHFMDDGTKNNATYSIATQCFTKQELAEYVRFLKEKYEIHCTIRANNEVYILAKSTKRFTKLINPYVIESMRYKLWI